MGGTRHLLILAILLILPPVLAAPSNMNITGTLYAPQICLAGNCQTNWPAGGSGGGGGWVNTSSTVYLANSSANVGIGTTNPLHKLQVNNRGIFVSGSVPYLIFSDTQTNGRDWGLYSGHPAAGYFKIRDNNASADRMVIDTNGNVGIGTTSPANLLDVSPNSTVTPATGGLKGISITNQDTTANALSGILFRAYDSGGTVRHGAAIVAGKEGAWDGSGTQWPSFLSFWTRPGSAGNPSEVEVMRINSNGNVGIGTTNPTSKLHVVGDGGYGNPLFTTYYDTDGSNIGVQRYRGTVAAPAALQLNDRIGGIIAGGAINSTNTANTASIEFSADESYTATAAGSRITFWTTINGAVGRQERMRITNSGLVGIGTTAPNEPLEVANSVYGGRFIVSNGGGAGRSVILIQAPGGTGGGSVPYGRILAHNYSSNGVPLVLQDSGGYVGIGSSPNTLLQVGATTFTGANGAYDNSRTRMIVGPEGTYGLNAFMITSTYNNAVYPNYGIVLVNGVAGNYDTWGIMHDGPAKATGGLQFAYAGNGTNIHTATPMVTFQKSGNVGIGTTSPGSTRLAVYGPGGASTSYGGIIRLNDIAASDQWTYIGLGPTSEASGFYMIGRGSAISDRVMSFHIPSSVSYGNGAQPKFLWASSGADSLMTLEASTGNLWIKGTLNGGTPITSSNIASQSVSSADMLDGVHAAALAEIIATKDDITTRTESGFYETISATKAEGWPEDSNAWYHMLATTHSNTGNYFSMQFAGSFYDSNAIYYRATNGNGATAWNKVWHSGNDGSGSGLDADTLDGTQPGSLSVNYANSAGSATSATTATNLNGGTISATGSSLFTLTHGQNMVIKLPAGNNGAGTGDAGLYLWISEPAVSWTGAGIGRNIYNNGASFSRVNPALSGQMIRFGEGSDIYFTVESAAGTRYTPLSISGDEVTTHTLKAGNVYPGGSTTDYWGWDGSGITKYGTGYTYISQGTLYVASTIIARGGITNDQQTYIDMSSKRLQNVATPSNTNDAATKGYVDGLIAGPYVAVVTASANCGTTATATCPAGMRVYGEYKCETSCPLDPADCPGVNQLGMVGDAGADQGATSASQVSRTCGSCSRAYVTVLCTKV